MKIESDKTVLKLVAVLRAADVEVPDDITPEVAKGIMVKTKGQKGQQPAVHLYIHVCTAQQCAQTTTEEQMGQNDPKSEQAAQ